MKFSQCKPTCPLWKSCKHGGIRFTSVLLDFSVWLVHVQGEVGGTVFVLQRKRTTCLSSLVSQSSAQTCVLSTQEHCTVSPPLSHASPFRRGDSNFGACIRLASEFGAYVRLQPEANRLFEELLLRVGSKANVGSCLPSASESDQHVNQTLMKVQDKAKENARMIIHTLIPQRETGFCLVMLGSNRVRSFCWKQGMCPDERR